MDTDSIPSGKTSWWPKRGKPLIHIRAINAPVLRSLESRRSDSSHPVEFCPYLKKVLSEHAESNEEIELFEREREIRPETWTPKQARILIGPPNLLAVIDDVNGFLIAKTVGADGLTAVGPGTIEKLASDLRYFLYWLADCWNRDDPCRDYLSLSSVHPEERATYAYRAYLVNLEHVAVSTKNNRIGAVRAFYEYLDIAGRLDPVSSQRFQSVRVTRVAKANGEVTPRWRFNYSSDLAIKHSKSDLLDTLADSVIDGGIVRPLPPAELDVVVAVLHKVDNPVLRLAAFLALNCGARLQTVLTLRRSHARQLLDKAAAGTSFALIRVGGYDLAQTKNNKLYSLQIPTSSKAMLVEYTDLIGRPCSIGELLGEFERSSFARERYVRLQRIRTDLSISLDNDEDEYLFLCRNGMPYYLHSEDPLRNLRKSPRIGGSFKRIFSLTVSRRVRIEASRAGLARLANTGVGFHDLRGTFAEQFLTRTITECIATGMQESRAREVATRQTQRALGHANVETTMRYLRFRDEKKQVLNANESYAQSLSGRTP